MKPDFNLPEQGKAVEIFQFIKQWRLCSIISSGGREMRRKSTLWVRAREPHIFLRLWLLIFFRSGAGFWFFAQAAHTPDFLFKRLRLLCWNSAEIPMPNMSSLYAWKMHCLCPRPVYIDIIFLDGFVKNSSSDIRGTWEPLSRWEPQVKHSELIKSLAWGRAVHCTFQFFLIYYISIIPFSALLQS